MFRKGLIPLLRDNPMGIAEIAHLMDLKPKKVEEDLKHLLNSDSWLTLEIIDEGLEVENLLGTKIIHS